MRCTRTPCRFVSSSVLGDKHFGAKGHENTKKAQALAKAKAIKISKNISELGKAGNWKEILYLYQEQKHGINAANFAAIMSQLGRIQGMRKDDPLFESVLDELSTKLHDRGIAWQGTNPRQLATIIHAIAKMKLPTKDNSSAMKIMRFLGDDKTATWLFEYGTPQAVSNCVWACGTLDIVSPDLFRLLDNRCEWLFEHGNPQDIANCVWTFGKLGIKSHNLFRLLDQHGEWLFKNGNTQDVANCIWACGTLGVKLPNLFRLLDQRCEWLFENGTPQNISNCVWACGTLGIESPNLFQLLEERCEWLFDNGSPQSPQHIANCVLACGTLGIKSPNLFRLLNGRSEWLFANGTPQAVANCVWACGTLDVELPHLFRLLDQRCEMLFDSGTPQNIANSVWACGTLGIRSPNLFRLLDQRGDLLFKNGNTQEVANCLWACGKLSVDSPYLFRLLGDYAEWLVQKGTPQHISICAWALSVMGTHLPAFFVALEAHFDKYLVDSTAEDLCILCQAIGVLDENLSSQSVMLIKLWNTLLDRTTGDLSIDELGKICYIQACASVYGIDLASPPSDLLRQLDQASFPTESSHFEDNVSNTLLKIGFSHQREFSPLKSFPGFLSIDMASPDRMIAIECDGPSHYLSTFHGVEKKRENGSTKAKRRLLKQLGWKVINISWMEYRMGDESVRVKLSEAGVEC